MRIGKRELVFSANSYCAAMLALLLSFACDLDRPYWAMMTAYVMAQPFSGALHSKAMFRIVGTVSGAAMMVILVPTLSNAPVLLSLAIAAWVGLCLFFSLLDRTPRSYFFLLAGYTTAFIGIPIVGAPATAFDAGVARVEEICIGVIASALFHTVFFPRSLRLSLADRFSEAMADLTDWCADTFARKKDAVRRRGRIRLAADITDLHLLATHVPFDVHEPQQLSRIIAAIEEKLIRLFPLITGLSDRFKQLERRGALPPRLVVLLAKISVWMRRPDLVSGKAEIQKQCHELQRMGETPSWHEMLLFNIATRLGELVEIYASCRELVAMAANREALRKAAIASGGHSRILHTDRMAAVYSAGACAGIIFIGSLLWMVSGWADGGTAVMMGTVTYCLFASQANPVPAQKMCLYYTALGSVVAGVYLFCVFPHVHSFITMALVLAPVLLVVGALLGSPGGMQYMSFVIPFCGSLTLTRHFQPDFQVFLNWNAAQFVGIAGTVAVTAILHRFSAHKRIRAVLSATASDISRIARGDETMNSAAWRSLMIDRIGLLAPYTDIIKSSDRYKSINAMAGLRTGLNVMRLRRAIARLPDDKMAGSEAFLLSVSDHFMAQAAGDGAMVPPDTLLARLDAEIVSLAAMPPGGLKASVLNALTGLRCSLFPQALEVGA